jgi:hypothetical protein
VRQYPALAGFEQESKSVSAWRKGKIVPRSSTHREQWSQRHLKPENHKADQKPSTENFRSDLAAASLPYEHADQ